MFSCCFASSSCAVGMLACADAAQPSSAVPLKTAPAYLVAAAALRRKRGAPPVAVCLRNMFGIVAFQLALLHLVHAWWYILRVAPQGSAAMQCRGMESAVPLQWLGGGLGGFLRHSPCRSHRQAAPSTASVCSSSKGLGGVPQGGGGGGGVAARGGKGWVRGKEARSGSACSRRFSAGSRGEFCMPNVHKVHPTGMALSQLRLPLDRVRSCSSRRCTNSLLPQISHRFVYAR